MEIRIEQGKKEEREKIRVIKRNGTKQGGRKSKSNAIINQKKKGGEKMGKKEMEWNRLGASCFNGGAQCFYAEIFGAKSS